MIDTTKEKAIPFIIWNQQNKNYILQAKAQQFIKSIPKPLSIISICGLPRTGKSYLLNKLILNRQSVFSVGATNTNCTKGLYIWGTSFIGKTSQGTNINILIIDSQGLECGQKQGLDDKLLCLLILISSHFVYNSIGSFNQKTFQNMKIFESIQKNLNITNQQQKKYADNFPNLIWVIRDFNQSNLTDCNNKLITEIQYLQQQLNQKQHQNQVKKIINKYFFRKQCFTFIRPLLNQSYLHKLDKLGLQNVRPQFFQKIMQFRKKILNNLRSKILKYKEIDGEMYLDLISKYLIVLNEGNKININEIQEYVYKKYVEKMLNQCLILYNKKINDQVESKFPFLQQDLKEILKKLFQFIVQKYRLYNLEDPNNLNLQKLIEYIKNKQIGVIQKNKQQCVKYVQGTVIKKFNWIQKKVRMNDYNSYSEFYKDLEQFRNSLNQQIQDLKINQLIYSKFVNKVLIEMSLHFERLKQNKYVRQRQSKQEQNQQLRQKVQYMMRTNVLQENKEKQRRDGLQGRLKCVQRQKELNEIRMSSEIARLRLQLQQCKDNLCEIQQKNMNELKQLKSKLVQLQFQNIQLKNKIIKQSSQQDTSLGLLLNKNNYLIQKNQQLLQIINKHSEKIAQLQLLKYKQSKNYQSKYQNIILSHSKQIQTYNDTISQYQYKIKSLQIQYQTLFNTHQQLNTKIQSHVSCQNNQINIKNNDNQQGIKNNSMIESLMRQKQGLKEQINRLENRIDEIINTNKIQKNNLIKQYAILRQEYEFNEIELKQLEAKYKELSEKQENRYKILDQIEDNTNQFENEKVIYENTINQLKKNIQKQKKLYQQNIQTILKNTQNSKFQYDLQITTFKQTISNNLISLQKYRSLIIQKQNQLIKLQQTKDHALQSYKSYYQSKVTQFQQQIQSIQTYTQTLKYQHQKNIQQQILQLKNYYEQQKLYLEKRSIQQKERIEKKYKYNMNEVEQKYKQQIRILQVQNQNMNEQYMKINNQLSENVKQLQYQAEIKQSKMLSLLKQLKDNQKNYEQNMKNSKQILIQKQRYFNQQISSFQNKVQKLKIQINKHINKTIILQTKLNQKQTIIQKINQQIQKINQANQILTVNYHQQIQQFKIKYQLLLDSSFKKQSQLDKQYALIKQINQFNQNKISSLQNQIQSYKKQASVNLNQVKKQLTNQMGKKIQQCLKQKQNITQKYNALKKNMRQLEVRFYKSTNQQQKSRLMHAEKTQNYQYRIQQLETKLNQVNKQKQQQVCRLESIISQSKEKANTTIKQLQIYIINLQNDKNRIQNQYHKNQMLWNSKLVFLDQQKQKLKNDNIQKIRKLEDALQLLNRSKHSEKNNQNYLQIRNAIEKKYEQKINELSSINLKQQLQYQQKIRLIQIDLRNEKQKNLVQNNRLKSVYNEKNQLQIRQLQKRLMSQIERLKEQKQRRNLQYQKQLSNEKEISKNKVKQLEQRIRQSDKKRSYMLFENEKQKTRWNHQKQKYKQTIEQLEDVIKNLKNNKQKIQRQNENYRYEKKRLKNSSINSSRWQQSRFQKIKGTNMKDYSMFSSSNDTKSPRSVFQQLEKQNMFQFIKLDDD